MTPRQRHTLLLLLLAVTLYLTWKAPAPEEAEGEVVEAMPSNMTSETTNAADSNRGNRILALKPRHSTQSSTNLFAVTSWSPPASHTPVVSTSLPVAEPTAPALPFKFLGKQHNDGGWEVYVASSNNTLILREQQIVDATYRVEAIKPPTMTLTYLPLNERQTLSIGNAE